MFKKDRKDFENKWMILMFLFSTECLQMISLLKKQAIYFLKIKDESFTEDTRKSKSCSDDKNEI